jgi:acetyl-CoA C-acetyltransferase
MAERVGIVAVAQTKYEASKPDLRMAELVYGPVKEILDKTGLKWTEDGTGIDFSICATDDFWDAMTISDTPIGDVIGSHQRSTEKVSSDGAQAAIYSAIAILSGHYDCVMVVAHCKESQPASRALITSTAFCPVCTRILGIDYLSAAALQAKRYMYKYGITREQCAEVVVKNRGNAKKNPYAQAPMDLTVEDVLGARMLADPIGALDAYPVTDGACAMLVAKEERAKKLTDKPVWVMGVGNCYDGHHLGDRDLADCDALELAAQRAYKMAGIRNPRRQIDVAEISEYYSYQELLWSEGLGFCGRGEGGKLIDSGATRMKGRLPINPSGGVLSGNPTIVAGLTRVVECFLQLRGEAGERQVAGAKTALAHGTTGPCGQLHSVLILGV